MGADPRPAPAPVKTTARDDSRADRTWAALVVAIERLDAPWAADDHRFERVPAATVGLVIKALTALKTGGHPAPLAGLLDAIHHWFEGRPPPGGRGHDHLSKSEILALYVDDTVMLRRLYEAGAQALDVEMTQARQRIRAETGYPHADGRTLWELTRKIDNGAQKFAYARAQLVARRILRE